MKEFFYRILFYLGVTVVGIIFYFIGNFFFGIRNEGGKRLIVAIAGIIFGVLGCWVISSYGDVLLDGRFPDGLFVFLGMTFLGFGIYLLFAALFASQKYIVKLFDGLLGGWNP